MASKDSKKDLLAKFQKLCNYITEYLTTRGVISSYDASKLRAQRSHKMRLDTMLEFISSRPDSAHVIADLRDALLREPSCAWFAEHLGNPAVKDEVKKGELEATVSHLSSVLSSIREGRQSSKWVNDVEPSKGDVFEVEQDSEDEPNGDDDAGGLTVELIGSLAEGDDILGISCLDDLVYIVRNNMSAIEVYDSDDDDFQFVQNMPVVGLRNPIDMAACERNGWLFVVDCMEDVKTKTKNPLVKAIRKFRSNSKVFRVNPVTRQETHWSVGDVAESLSVTPSTTVIVTCYKSQKLREFTADGKPVRAIALHKELSNPLHAILLSNGELIISQGQGDKSPHRVCRVYAKDKCPPIVTYGDGEDEDEDEYLNVPMKVAVHSCGLVLVADAGNARIVLLNSSLQLVRHINISGGDTATEQETDEYQGDEDDDAAATAADNNDGDEVPFLPLYFCVDESRSRIYVAFNDPVEDVNATSKILVYHVAF